jgi:uncharacterized protein (UPF0147 family)
MAGYSPKTQRANILKTKKVTAAIQSIDEMRRLNAMRPGHTYLDNAEVLQEIRDDENVPENVRIQAIKEHNQMQGNYAPKEIKTSNMHLIAELGIFNDVELDAFAEGDISDIDFDDE